MGVASIGGVLPGEKIKCPNCGNHRRFSVSLEIAPGCSGFFVRLWCHSCCHITEVPNTASFVLPDELPDLIKDIQGAVL